MQLKVGDRVAFSVQFCRNTLQFSGRTPAMRGVLLALPNEESSFARVKWDDWNEVKRDRLAQQWGEDYAEEAERLGEPVNFANLAKVGLNTKFAAC